MNLFLTFLLSDLFFLALLGLALLSSTVNLCKDDYISGWTAFFLLVSGVIFAVKQHAALSVTFFAWVIPIYLIVGLVWSIIKWGLFTRELVTSYKENFDYASTYIERRYCKDDDDYNARVERHREGLLSSLKNNVKPYTQKHRIKSWIALWPVSVGVTCTYKSIDHIYNYCVNIYQKTTTRIMSAANIPV